MSVPTLGEVLGAEPQLAWRRLQRGDGAPLDAAAVAAASEADYRAARASLPAAPGVYVWSALPDSGGAVNIADSRSGGDSSDNAEDDDSPGDDGEDGRAVLYVGVAKGRGGLASRLSGQLHWIRGQQQWRRSLRWRQRFFSGHPRVMLERDARLHYAATPPSAGQSAAVAAAETERALLHFCRFATGSVPPVNGSGWWSTGDNHDRARDRAWTAIRRTPALLARGGPGDEQRPEQLADPPEAAR